MLIKEDDKIIEADNKLGFKKINPNFRFQNSTNSKNQGFIPGMLMKIDAKLNMLLMMNRNYSKENGTLKSRFNSSRYPNQKTFHNKLNRNIMENN